MMTKQVKNRMSKGKYKIGAKLIQTSYRIKSRIGCNLGVSFLFADRSHPPFTLSHNWEKGQIRRQLSD